jgi:hypothetical protein
MSTLFVGDLVGKKITDELYPSVKLWNLVVDCERQLHGLSGQGGAWTTQLCVRILPPLLVWLVSTTSTRDGRSKAEKLLLFPPSCCTNFSRLFYLVNANFFFFVVAAVGGKGWLVVIGWWLLIRSGGGNHNGQPWEEEK